MDSAYYTSAVTSAIRRQGAWFSVTVPMNASIRAAIASISDGAWTAIRYPQAIWDDQLDCWISDAEVAEIQYTAFASKKKSEQVTARLIVRRVRDLQREGRRRAGRAVPRLALPRRAHRLAVRAGPGRGPAPRPRHRRAGHRRLERRPARSPAIRCFRSQRRVARHAAAMAHNLLRAAGTLASPAARRPAPPRSAAT